MTADFMSQADLLDELELLSKISTGYRPVPRRDWQDAVEGVLS